MNTATSHPGLLTLVSVTRPPFPLGASAPHYANKAGLDQALWSPGAAQSWLGAAEEVNKAAEGPSPHQQLNLVLFYPVFELPPRILVG